MKPSFGLLSLLLALACLLPSGVHAADPAPGQQQGRAWTQIRSNAQLAARYEFQNLTDAESPLLSEDVDTLLLFRPRDLTDRQKYVFDQFLMRGGTIVLAGTKGYKPIPDFISDVVVGKEITIKGALGVTSSAYRSAIRTIESRALPLETMHTHDFALEEAELAIRTLAREIPGEESIHSCLIP